MLTWIDTTWCVLLAYVAALAATFSLGLVESRRRRAHAVEYSHLWPRFWYATTILLLVMALGRLSDTGELLANLGRERARSSGWYQTRRNAQAWVVGTLATLWLASVIAAVWRVPERRRRYLPTAVVVVTLVCYAAARMVSFHPVDSLLYRTELGGARLTALIETSILLVVVGTAAWNAPPTRRSH